jgi:hypothetical protein
LVVGYWLIGGWLLVAGGRLLVAGGRLHVEKHMFDMAGLVEADQTLPECFDLVF